jgi:hypothetical protein
VQLYICSRSRVLCSNSKNFEEWIERRCEEFKKPAHQTLQSTFQRSKIRMGYEESKWTGYVYL